MCVVTKLCSKHSIVLRSSAIAASSPQEICTIDATPVLLNTLWDTRAYCCVHCLEVALHASDLRGHWVLLACRSAVAEALPQLQVLDGVPLAGERACLAAEHRPAAQHLAELQLQAYEPQRPGSIVEQQQLTAACSAEAVEGAPEQASPWPVPIIFLQGTAPTGSGHVPGMQQLSEVPRVLGRLPELPGGDAVQNLADRLAQRLAQSGAAPPGQPSTGAAGQEQRWASLEARVAALQSGQLGGPAQAQGPQACPSQSLPGVREDGAANTVQMQPAGRHGSRCSIAQVDPHKVQELQVGCDAAFCLGVSSCSVIRISEAGAHASQICWDWDGEEPCMLCRRMLRT